MTRRSRWLLALLATIYLVALAASWHVQSDAATKRPPSVAPSVEVAPHTKRGVASGDPVRIAYRTWTPDAPRDGALPALLIHGSPGGLGNFYELGPRLAETGREAIALDLPGFGRSSSWIPDYSTRAHARYTLAMMDELGIQRVHIAGWSMGGGVCLDMADIAPERIASVTMMAAIGAQETEGSGSYLFEHVKYAFGYAALVALPEAVPHFGLLGPREFRHATMRNFFDTDQRRYAEIMRSLSAPTLILHGREDFLVADWAAEYHHDLTPTSRLVMTPDSHFLPIAEPFGQAGFTAASMHWFLARHDDPRAAPLIGAAILEPADNKRWLEPIRTFARFGPWWLLGAIIALLARFKPETTTAAAATLVADMSLDVGLAATALTLGRATRPRQWWERRSLRRWITRLAWPAVSLIITQIAVGALDLFTPWLVIPGVIAVTLGLWTLRLAPTREGRQRLTANLTRWLHHEWWPQWLLYAGVAPSIMRLALAHRGPMTWTCANPGIEPGGGVIGESKTAITNGFHPSDERVLPVHPISRSHASREAHGSESPGFPCILKPDVGERGAGVRLINGEHELRRVISEEARQMVAQEYHPGPREAGVFWVRHAEAIGREHDAPPPHGFVFAVTRKTFPTITGDGTRTLRRLIMDHPRYRKQAAVYVGRFADRIDDVPAAGETITLATTGNHIRGCIFSDGADLITAQLEASIDEVMRSWRGPGGQPFDFGRCDLRYASDDELKAGRGYAIVELNGTTSEATNLYDPDGSWRWAMDLLRRQWTHAFELGARRRALGRQPMSIPSLVRGLAAARRA